MTYAACGIVLDTDVWLPELGPAHRPDPDCAFRMLPRQERCADPTSWIYEQRLADGQMWLSIAKRGTGYLIRFPSYADFLVTGGGREIGCVPVPGTPMETIRHLLLDLVLPLALATSGRLVLHAAAVEVDGRALVFLGPSGAGKSTLVGALCQRGGTVLADDCVVIEIEEDGSDGVAHAVPSYAGLRLWPASVSALYESGTPSRTVAHYTEKRRVTPGNGRHPRSPRSVRIAGMYVLDPVEPSPESVGDRVRAVPLARREGCMELVKNAFQLDVTDASAVRRSFEQVGRLASMSAVSRLQYVRDFTHLPTVVDTVMADHRGEPQPCG